MKPYKHICKNCWFYRDWVCTNCFWTSDNRDKKPNDICDGGGRDAEVYGFRPKDVDGSWILIRTD